jgi:rhomboid family GlyGly-CTERM serine protease
MRSQCLPIHAKESSEHTMKAHKTEILEGLIFCTLLLTANISLLSGTQNTAWVLRPSAIQQGEWWRFILHPWVHVSGYHLLLDVTAFLSLFFMLDRKHTYEPWLILLVAWSGQLFAVWFGDPQLHAIGLCGLSGIAHGLFAAVCMQWRSEPQLRKMGNLLLLGVVAKCVWEAISGQVFLTSLHFGSVGTPLTLCHAGGVAGVVMAACISAMYKKIKCVSLVPHIRQTVRLSRL